MNDSELKEYFHQNRPMTGDNTTYITGLYAKMNAVDEIKQLHDASIRKYHRICIVTFASGFVVGIIIITIILLYPEFVSQFKSDIIHSLHYLATEWKVVLIATIIAITLTFELIQEKV